MRASMIYRYHTHVIVVYALSSTETYGYEVLRLLVSMQMLLTRNLTPRLFVDLSLNLSTKASDISELRVCDSVAHAEPCSVHNVALHRLHQR